MIEMVWTFFIYGFLGWCSEVIFAAVKQGKFVNRGFLNGPICPIYGVGVTLVIWLLKPVSQQWGWLYIGSVVVTSALEFLTGYVLEKVFHDKWWDYSNNRFNIKGYICLSFSLLWGVACVVVVRGIHPPILKLIGWLQKYWPGYVLLGVLAAGFISDCIITLVSTWHLSRKLKALDDIQSLLLKTSNDIGSNLSNRVLALQEVRESLEEHRPLFEQSSWIHRRLLNAFPHMASEKRELIQQIREHFKK